MTPTNRAAHSPTGVVVGLATIAGSTANPWLVLALGAVAITVILLIVSLVRADRFHVPERRHP